MCKYKVSEHSVAVSCCGGCGETKFVVPNVPMFTRPDDAIKMLSELFEHALDTFKRKNKGYADAGRTLDVLENFRSEAQAWGLTMAQYAGILRGKHEKAWRTFVRGGEVPDHPWRILKDRLIYTLIEYLICLDNGLFSHENVMQDTKEGS